MHEINLPDVFDEVSAIFMRYEQALVTNDVATLNELFYDSPLTIRYGLAENLYGYSAISTYRTNRPNTSLARTLQNTVITTYGQDFATANTLFIRDGKTGRQSQTWVKMPEGWRVVSAHVSMMTTSN